MVVLKIKNKKEFAYQLVEDDSLNSLVDQFYFEDRVNMNEIAHLFPNNMEGSVKDALDLMGDLREKGVAAHFWA